MLEISSGGVVIVDGEFLLLKKFSSEWVLPKGRLEDGENAEQAAIREVKEEAGIDATVVRYLGYVKYDYNHNNGEKIKKTVHYYYMQGDNIELVPQREEGFVDAVFLPYEKAIRFVKHDAERNMIKTAYYFYKKKKK